MQLRNPSSRSDLVHYNPIQRPKTHIYTASSASQAGHNKCEVEYACLVTLIPEGTSEQRRTVVVLRSHLPLPLPLSWEGAPSTYDINVFLPPEAAHHEMSVILLSQSGLAGI